MDYYQIIGCKDVSCRLFGNCFCDLPQDKPIIQRVVDEVFAAAPELNKLRANAEHIVPLPEVAQLDGVKSVYELTLTTTKNDPQELLVYLTKITASRMFSVLGYKACFELTKAGLPHIHVMLWSGKDYLNVAHIREKIKFPYRFELKRVRLQQNFYNYIHKELGNKEVEAYCNNHNISQIWEYKK